jgi:bacterioferritin (cytochrome b1)
MIHVQNMLPVTDVLNQLLHLLLCGLPAYVVEINPWIQPGQESIRKALANLADDRRLYANRTIQAIMDRDGHPDSGSFPLEYTGLNDVSIEYLINELTDSLHLDMEILEALSAQLADISDLHALVEEVLGNTKGHAEILEQMKNSE